MKVLGTARKDHYLVEMTEHEIALCAGLSPYSDQWEKLNGGKREPQGGLEIQVQPIAAWHRRILENENSAASAANTLRALADLITTNLPSVIIPPVSETKAETE